MKEAMKASVSVLIQVVRVVLFGAVLVWGCWFLLGLRTGVWGSVRSVGRLAISAAFLVLPPALIVCLSRSWRRMVAGALIICLVSIVVCEGIATFEEYLFRRQCASMPEIKETVFKNRWWPFENHFIYYDPSTKTFGGGD